MVGRVVIGRKELLFLLVLVVLLPLAVYWWSRNNVDVGEPQFVDSPSREVVVPSDELDESTTRETSSTSASGREAESVELVPAPAESPELPSLSEEQGAPPVRDGVEAESPPREVNDDRSGLPAQRRRGRRRRPQPVNAPGPGPTPAAPTDVPVLENNPYL